MVTCVGNTVFYWDKEKASDAIRDLKRFEWKSHYSYPSSAAVGLAGELPRDADMIVSRHSVKFVAEGHNTYTFKKRELGL